MICSLRFEKILRSKTFKAQTNINIQATIEARITPFLLKDDRPCAELGLVPVLGASVLEAEPPETPVQKKTI